jgi:hypothetical protein
MGLDPDAFWTKTPRYIALVFEGKAAQFRREHNERMSLAWHAAGLPRMKKFPDLKKLLARETFAARKRPQTSDEQWAIFGAMAEASKVLRKN